MDTRSSVAFLRRRWPVLLTSGLIGAVLGLLYGVLVPAQLTSTSLILLQGAGQSASDGVIDIDTQVRLALSRPVLQRAGRAVHPAESATEVEREVSADGATAQLMEIQASSPRSREAQALAQAVAEAYVATVADNTRSVVGTTIGELQSREKLLAQQVQALQDQIAATTTRKNSEDPRSPESRRDSQLLAQLTVDRAEAALKWNQVQLDLTTGATAGSANPASIVQPAAPAGGPGVLSHLLPSALGGAALLAVLAALALLFRARRDPSLRTRDDLADAVASTVLADVRSRPQRSVAEWLALFQTYEASPVDAWAFRQVLHALAGPDERGVSGIGAKKRLPGRVEHPRSVTVISLAGDRRGLALGPQLASFAASVGMVTHFVAANGHSSAASLWAACTSDRASHLRPDLIIEARSQNPEPGDDERGVGPPPETFDEVLKGLFPSDQDEGDDDREAAPNVGEDAETAEEVADADSADTAADTDTAADIEDAEDAEDADAPDSPDTAA